VRNQVTIWPAGLAAATAAVGCGLVFPVSAVADAGYGPLIDQPLAQVDVAVASILVATLFALGLLGLAHMARTSRLLEKGEAADNAAPEEPPL